jgi:hypothetical protein
MFQTTNQYIYIAQAKEGIYPRTTIEHFPGPQSLQLVVPSPTIAIRSQPNFAAVLHEDLLCFVVRDIDIVEKMGKYAYTHIFNHIIYIYIIKVIQYSLFSASMTLSRSTLAMENENHHLSMGKRKTLILKGIMS